MSSKNVQDGTSVVELLNVNKVYGFTIALKKINLTIKKGEVIGLIGHNGAGKSTLLKIISLLIRPTSGVIKLFDTEVKQNQYLLKKEIGVLLSHSFFYDDLTGRENLEYYLRLNKRVKNPKESVKNAVKKYNLKMFIDRPVHELSTGMAKKLEILRVALPNPPLLLLDEPFSGLDVENRQFLDQIITDTNHKSKRTVIICSHDFGSVARYCNRVLYLEKGRISKDLGPSEYDFFLEKQK
jgi:ABC-type multidrug transport system ATPase subunit